MTSQRYDFFYFEGVRHPIVAAAPIPFIPAEFGLLYGGMLSTACYRGFYADYEAVDQRLRWHELRLSVHPRDLQSVMDGRVFGRPPDQVTGDAITYHNLGCDYDGTLIVKMLSSPSSPIAADHKYREFVFQHGSLVAERPLAAVPQGMRSKTSWVDLGEILWRPPE